MVDRNGNIVGDPIVGAITEKKQAEELQAQIDKALSADIGLQTEISPQGGIRAIRRRTGDVRRLMAILDEVFAD